jgi:transcriptional regulator with XRE-family HTH domain
MSQAETQRFGQYIKRLRSERKLGVRELASKAGISHTVLSRLENGKRKPQLNTLKALAPALGVPLADLFAMAGYVGPYDLPSVTPYLRARYGHLSEEALASANDYLERLIDEYGLDPNGPLPFEDETNEPAPH